MDINANPYFLVAINGFCTGIGVAIAQWIHEKSIKPKLEKMHATTHKILNGHKKKSFINSKKKRR